MNILSSAVKTLYDNTVIYQPLHKIPCFNTRMTKLAQRNLQLPRRSFTTTKVLLKDTQPAATNHNYTHISLGQIDTPSEIENGFHFGLPLPIERDKKILWRICQKLGTSFPFAETLLEKYNEEMQKLESPLKRMTAAEYKFVTASENKRKEQVLVAIANIAPRVRSNNTFDRFCKK